MKAILFQMTIFSHLVKANNTDIIDKGRGNPAFLYVKNEISVIYI